MIESHFSCKRDYISTMWIFLCPPQHETHPARKWPAFFFFFFQTSRSPVKFYRRVASQLNESSKSLPDGWPIKEVSHWLEFKSIQEPFHLTAVTSVLDIVSQDNDLFSILWFKKSVFPEIWGNKKGYICCLRCFINGLLAGGFSIQLECGERSWVVY